MKIDGSVALVTGANRGLGAAFCRALLDRGATTVYAGARDLRTVSMDGVIPVPLNVTSAKDIAGAADRCGDVTLLVNNAGIGTGTSALATDALDAARLEFETNVLGPLALAGLTLDGVESGAHEVLADDISRHVRRALSGDLTALYPRLAR